MQHNLQLKMEIKELLTFSQNFKNWKSTYKIFPTILKSNKLIANFPYVMIVKWAKSGDILISFQKIKEAISSLSINLFVMIESTIKCLLNNTRAVV